MIFRFGRHELDEEAGELRRDGDAIAIQPKPFALLRHLIRERDRVVEHDELFELLWPGVAVTPSSLTRAVSVARGAIGDAGRGDVLRSIARRGYRFCADVVAIDAAVRPASERAREGGVAGGEAFVGRDAALGQLREAWTQAATGRGGLVLVTGPPGIGKTRLTEVFGAEVEAAGARLLVGRAREGEGVPPLWLWAQVLRKLDAKALPDLALELAGDATEPRDEGARSPAQSRFLLFDGVTRALADASRTQPLVIVLEDLQWAGSASLRLLEHASFEIGDAALLVVATLRDEARPRAHPVERTLATLRAQALTREIALRGFSRREVAQLLERALGRPAPPDLSSELAARTDGVPLLLREALRLLRERGDLRQPEGVRRWAVSLPGQALDLIRRPLERLSPRCAALLAASAVLGREWPLAIAAAVAGISREAALDLVDEAEAAGVVERAADTAPATTWRFSHALYQEAVYAALPAGRRARLHAQAADELERRHGAAAERVVAELAHHHHEALAVGDPERAFAAATAAAAHAARVCAFEQMATHYAQALDALDHAEPIDAVRRLETLLALGEALRLSGDRGRRRSVFERAMAAARTLERPVDFARAAIGFCDLSEWAPRDAEARGALEEALDRLGAEAPVERARVLVRIAYLGASGRRDPESEATARRAIEEARCAGDPDALQEALYTFHFLAGSPHRLEERAVLAPEIVAAARRSVQRDPAVIALVDAASDRLALGDAQGAHRARKQAEEIAGPNPHLGMLWHLRTYDAGVAQMEGRREDAERGIAEALAIGTRIEHPFTRGVWITQHVELARDRERWQEVVDAIDLGATTPWLGAIAARALLALGREREARGVLDALAARGFDTVRRNVRWTKTLIEITGLCCDLGDAAHAAPLRELLAPFDRLHGVLPVPVCYGGPVAHALARLAALLGDTDAAAGHYEDALAGAEALGARPAQARILADHAALLARRGDRRGARPLAERAHALARDLAMPALADRAQAIASR
ncbi:MAG: AAA family ATPase [Myxococcota bacterium]|nr:AAA family ATPase [Myxococcota bacterium]